MEREQRLRGYEDRFRAAGLVSFCRRPHLRPVQTVMLASAAILAAEAAFVLPERTWTVAARVLAIVGAGVLSWAAGRTLARFEHTVRRRTARYATEAAFLVVPTLFLVAVGGAGDGLRLGAVNAVLLAAYVLEERAGLRYVFRWAVVFARRRLRGSARTTWRTVPVLTVVLFALFLAAETWQVAGRMNAANFVLLGGLLLLGAVVAGDTGISAKYDLRRAERANITALSAVATGTIAATTATVFALFMFVVGAVAVDAATLQVWLGRTIETVDISLVATFTFSAVHAKMAALIGAVAGFVFSAALGSSDAYRALSNDALRSEIDEALEARREYLELLEASPSGMRPPHGTVGYEDASLR